MGNIEKAIRSLRPDSEWIIAAGEIKFIDGTEAPTQEEIDTEVARIEAEESATEYQRLRKAEYPPMEDYLDAVVKNDEVAIQAYKDACLAVKAKYPKPE